MQTLEIPAEKRIYDVANNHNLQYFEENQLLNFASIIISPYVIIHQLLTHTASDIYISYHCKKNPPYCSSYTYVVVLAR